MTALPHADAPQTPPISPEEGKIWRDRWRQASEMDRQIRAQRIRGIDWERDWPWIDGLLRLGVKFADPRLPVGLMEYRRRLEEKLPR